ncbi:GNAT family N-acetyltransferase [Rheinheimera aquimaris]|uniref:GNAT family N-acetyltransferase n=1 Tax=Rheinheimera aquimaris TaxID=412437 RepID=UPI003A968B58
MIIRCCDTEDLQGLLDLYRELRPHDPTLKQHDAQQAWHKLLANPGIKIIVAEIDGVLASTCQLSICQTLTNAAKPFGIIEHVITAEAYRRRGLSEKVIERALDIAWEQNCYKVMLLSGESRTAAHKLYEKIGFQSGIERGFVIKPDLG